MACEMRFGANRKGSNELTNRVDQLLASLTILPLDLSLELLRIAKTFEPLCAQLLRLVSGEIAI